MAQTVDVMQLSLHFRYITVSKFSPYTHCHVTFNNSVIPHLLFPVLSSLSLPPRPVPPFSPPSPFPYPQSPSVYSSYRRKALEFTFSCLSETLGHREAEDEPLFLYGDFNFRLDFSAVVKVRTCCNCRLNTLFYTQALHVKSLCTLYVYKGGQVLTFSLLPSPSSPPLFYSPWWPPRAAHPHSQPPHKVCQHWEWLHQQNRVQGGGLLWRQCEFCWWSGFSIQHSGALAFLHEIFSLAKFYAGLKTEGKAVVDHIQYHKDHTMHLSHRRCVFWGGRQSYT